MFSRFSVKMNEDNPHKNVLIITSINTCQISENFKTSCVCKLSFIKHIKNKSANTVLKNEDDVGGGVGVIAKKWNKFLEYQKFVVLANLNHV